MIYAIGLGSNLGDRLSHLRRGVEGLSRLGTVGAVSSLYESAPVGGPSQDPFLNAVVLLDSSLTVADLLASLQEIERSEGRVRGEPWGPRTLDLDIITTDGAGVETAGLTVPHRLAAERRFVLEPLAEVWPEAPVGPRGARDALGAVQDQEVVRLARRWARPHDLGKGPGRYLVAGQFALFLVIAGLMLTTGSLPTGESLPGRLPGVVLAVIGGGLALLGALALGPALTPLPEPVAGFPLVERGPYSLVRHPIYGGVALLLAGAGLFLATLPATIASILLAGYFWLKASYEERRLRIVYPGYRAYMVRVPRRMIPFLI